MHMHWTAGFRMGSILDATGPPSVMCIVGRMNSVLHRSIIVTPRSVFWIVVGQSLVSALAAAMFMLFESAPEARRLSGAIGFLTALWGTGIAFWFSLRMRAPACFVASVLSLLPLAFWLWVICARVSTPNHPAAGKAGITRLLAIGHHGPGLPEPVR
jgi:hypothetical protein